VRLLLQKLGHLGGRRMAKISPQLLQKALEKSHYVLLHAAHGDAGVAAFKRLLEAIREIYKFVEPETTSDPIIIFHAIEGDDAPLPLSDSVLVTQAHALRNVAHGEIAIQALAHGQFRVWRGIKFDVKAIAQKTVVYRYHRFTEQFHTKNDQAEVINYVQGLPSVFAIPTFASLRDAIEHYGLTMARHSSCKILNKVWHDQDRIFLKNASEYILRDSLTQYLKNVMRDAEVRPEQVVDESHPVDIKVTWLFNNRLALIEIKWIGTSRTDAGAILAYQDARANQGAKQLAEYLDWNIQQAPVHITRGFLVVFDARRRALKPATVSVNTADGLHHQDVPIKFDPKYDELRKDFEKPARLFLEPICR